MTSLSLFTFTHRRRKWQPTPVFLAGESQGQGSLVGCHLRGSHRVRHDWSDLAEQCCYKQAGTCISVLVFSPFEFIPRSRNRIARSCGNSMFNVLGNQKNVFQSSWTTLCSQKSTWQFWNAVSSAFQDILLSVVPHSLYIHVYTYIYEGEWKSLSHVWLFATPWAVAHQAPLSMEFSKQEYWSGWLLPSPGDLPSLGIEPRPPTLQVDSLPSEPPGNPLYMATSYIFFSSNFSSCSLLEVFFRFLSWLSSAGFYQPQQSHPTWWL